MKTVHLYYYQLLIVTLEYKPQNLLCKTLKTGGKTKNAIQRDTAVINVTHSVKNFGKRLGVRGRM